MEEVPERRDSMRKKPKERKQGSLMSRVVLILCLTIIPLNLLSIFLSFQTAANLRHTYRQSIVTALDGYTGNIAQRMENTDFLLYDYFSSDQDFASMISQTQQWRYQLHRKALFSSIENTLQISSAADAVFVYVPEVDDLLLVDRLLFNAESVPERMPRMHLKELILDASHTTGRWHFHEFEDTQYLIRIVHSKHYSIGAYINCNAILKGMPPMLGQTDAVYFFSEEPLTQMPGFMLCSSALPGNMATLHCGIPSSSIPKRISFGLVLLVVSFLLSLLIVPGFIYYFRKRINAPLKALRYAFRELEKGNEDYRIPEQNVFDEFSDTFRSFNAMAGTISTLRAKALDEAERQHALTVHNLSLKLDNLQLQIRPHFLLNTMNLLFTLIQKHQEENAKRLVLYLSRYFRYMFRYGHELELFDKEIEMVKEYLTISQLHYADAFTVSYQMDPIISFMRIPPLLLHNFVENIIQHALTPGKTVHIVLYGEYNEEEKTVTLQISDDGRGMPERFVDMINRNDFSSVPTGKHIGIRNSINRLQHYYDGRATVFVESVMDGGTTFTITIPQEIVLE